MKALLEHDTSTVSEPGPTADESIERVPVPTSARCRDLHGPNEHRAHRGRRSGTAGGTGRYRRTGPHPLIVGARPPRAPMLRTLRLTRLGQGTPAWIDAPDFDIADHVILAPADRSLNHENDLLAWCARRSLIPLERTRPLWRLDIIPGLPGGRIGVLLVLHHVVADGLRGVALVTSLLDSTRQGRGEGAAWHQPAPAGFDLVRDNVRTRWDAIRRFRPSRLVRSARTMRALSTHLDVVRPPRHSPVRSRTSGTSRSFGTPSRS